MRVTRSLHPSPAMSTNTLPLRAWLCALLVGLLATGLRAAEPVINVNFGPGVKVGQAAAGSATNDFWNSYYPTNSMGQLFDPSSAVPLFSADYTNAGVGILVWNVSTNGTNNLGDAMFDSWLAADGTNLYVTLTNVPYGCYDIYVYGHGDSNELNSTVMLLAAWGDYGTNSTTNTSDWSTNVWVEGAQYVVFRDVMIPKGQNVAITVGTNSAGLAILNGLQLVGKTVPENQDTDGDGLTDRQELAYGSNPFAADTRGDGINDYTRWKQGRSPTAGSVADTGSLVNLQVFTLLR